MKKVILVLLFSMIFSAALSAQDMEESATPEDGVNTEGTEMDTPSEPEATSDSEDSGSDTMDSSDSEGSDSMDSTDTSESSETTGPDSSASDAEPMDNADSGEPATDDSTGMSEGTTEEPPASNGGAETEYYKVPANKPAPPADYAVFENGPAAKIHNIYFANARWYYGSASKPVLHRIIKELEKKPDHGVLIVGHTDHIGTYKQNLTLSWRRAAAVRNGLVMHGLDKSRTKIVGASEKYQVYKNAKTNSKRRYNRRVTFAIKPLSELYDTPPDYFVK